MSRTAALRRSGPVIGVGEGAKWLLAEETEIWNGKAGQIADRDAIPGNVNYGTSGHVQLDCYSKSETANERCSDRYTETERSRERERDHFPVRPSGSSKLCLSLPTKNPFKSPLRVPE